jgi:hypothetical protein
MGGAVPPLHQYAFMVWCSIRESTGTTLPSYVLITKILTTIFRLLHFIWKIFLMSKEYEYVYNSQRFGVESDKL